MRETITDSYRQVNNPKLLPAGAYFRLLGGIMKFQDFAQRFATVLREARPPLPTTNKDLGRVFDLSGPMISYLRNGDKLPSMETAQRIASRCGVCVEWLLTGRGPKYPSIPQKTITQAASLVIQAIPELNDSQTELVARMVQELLAVQNKADS